MEESRAHICTCVIGRKERGKKERERERKERERERGKRERERERKERERERERGGRRERERGREKDIGFDGLVIGQSENEDMQQTICCNSTSEVLRPHPPSGIITPGTIRQLYYVTDS